ncbi:MAG TPA: CDP-alcohol phosphatidyltransferase family protein [Acidimicrobiales bacterium]|nr:CDP-alcohol phosphatidyltransferase family protein [Acidimicrobiales bacterium]
MFRRTIGPFGVKDLFTMVNLLSGVVAVGYVLRNQPRHAGYAVIVGFLLGDLVDGTVARRTGTANRFGAEFDSVSDHFVHVFVPGLVFFSVYERGGHGALGLVAVAALISGATLRHARFAAARFDYPLCWCGLPRTISGFAALSFPLSTLFGHGGAAYPIGCAVVGGLSALNLAPIPYLTHRGRRAMQPYVKVLVGGFFLALPLSALVARRYTFDLMFVGMLWFACTGWIPVHPDERRDFRVEYRRWAAELSGSRRTG